MVPTRNWSQVIRLAKERKIDLLPALAQTQQRKSYLLFTQPYDRIPGIVVSIQGYDSIDDLLGKRIAVVSDTYWDDLLSDRQIDIQIQHVDSAKFGMELAAMGTVDAMVTDLASATAIIKQTGISNLHRCQPWRAKRRLADPSSSEAALFSRRALRQRENKVGLRTRRPVIWEPSTEQQRACEVVA